MHDDRIDFTRCVMNYMIVVLHAWAAFQYVPNDNMEFVFWTFVCRHLCWLAMPTFFMISGYLLFQNYTARTYPMKMWRRVKKLLIPYIVWNVTFVVIYLSLSKVVPRLGLRVATFGLDTVKGALFKILNVFELPIDGPLWFIRTLFLLALISPLLYVFMRWSKVLTICLCLIWCVAEVYMGYTDALHLVLPSYGLTCFVIGGVIALSRRNLISFFSNKIYLITGFVFCFLRGIVGIWDLGREELQFSLQLLMVLGAIIEAPVLIWLLPKILDKLYGIGGKCRILKDMSFFAYAGHFLFCSAWLHGVAPFCGALRGGKFTILSCCFIICGMITIMAVYAVARKVCPRILRLYDGTL